MQDLIPTIDYHYPAGTSSNDMFKCSSRYKIIFVLIFVVQTYAQYVQNYKTGKTQYIILYLMQK